MPAARTVSIDSAADRLSPGGRQDRGLFRFIAPRGMDDDIDGHVGNAVSDPRCEAAVSVEISDRGLPGSASGDITGILAENPRAFPETLRVEAAP